MPWPDTRMFSQECGLYWCVNEYQSYFSNGTFNESVVEVPARRARRFWDHDGAWPDASLEFHNSVIYDRPLSRFPGEMRLCPNSSTQRSDCFWATADTILSVNNHFHKLFATNVTPDNAAAGLGPGRLENDAHLVGGTIEPDLFRYLWSWRIKTDMGNTFEGLAYSISNEIRASRPDHAELEDIPITIGRLIPVYDMRWTWLSLHCATLLLGAVFLYLTIARTSATAAPSFKSHSLAILANGSHLFPAVTGAERGQEIDKWARENQAKFRKDPLGRCDDTDEAYFGQIEMHPWTIGANRSSSVLQRDISVSSISSSNSSRVNPGM
ncbi:uncharacterized protein PG998_010718 [Apiospora kogelbergensis]|uniref:uncharacterized protein n=1 Tax=Apiospora kogelbergensis TaxID=1337665 RepID=UPI00312D95AB